MFKKILFLACAVLCQYQIWAHSSFKAESPNGSVVVTINLDQQISYRVDFKGTPIIESTPIEILLTDGKVWGKNPSLKKSTITKADKRLQTFAYFNSEITDNYKGIILQSKDGFAVEFRAYDDMACYRFISESDAELFVENEKALFPFAADYVAYAPYVISKDNSFDTFRSQFNNTFENSYTHGPLSRLNPRRLIFTPVAVEVSDNIKVVLAESDLEGYPGMYLNWNPSKKALEGVFAPT